MAHGSARHGKCEAKQASPATEGKRPEFRPKSQMSQVMSQVIYFLGFLQLVRSQRLHRCSRSAEVDWMMKSRGPGHFLGVCPSRLTMYEFLSGGVGRGWRMSCSVPEMSSPLRVPKGGRWQMLSHKHTPHLRAAPAALPGKPPMDEPQTN